MIQQHVQYLSAKAASILLQCPHLVAGGTAQVLILSHLNHLSACHYRFRRCLGVICVNQICWKLLKAEDVLGSDHFGVLCSIKASSAIILFKMYIPFLKGWTAERADCCPL